MAMMMVVVVKRKLAVIEAKNHDSDRMMMYQEKGLVSAMDEIIQDLKMHAFDEELTCVSKDLLHLHMYVRKAWSPIYFSYYPLHYLPISDVGCWNRNASFCQRACDDLVPQMDTCRQASDISISPWSIPLLIALHIHLMPFLVGYTVDCYSIHESFHQHCVLDISNLPSETPTFCLTVSSCDTNDS